jgi:hypothetical protein
MLLALLIIAEAEAAEPSKTPFFIAGGLLAAWAMVVFFVGMRTPGFPRSQGAARGVMAISFVLMAAAMATAVITA